MPNVVDTNVVDTNNEQSYSGATFNGFSEDQYNSGYKESVQIADGQYKGQYGWVMKNPAEFQLMAQSNNVFEEYLGKQMLYIDIYSGANAGEAVPVPAELVIRDSNFEPGPYSPGVTASRKSRLRKNV